MLSLGAAGTRSVDPANPRHARACDLGSNRCNDATSMSNGRETTRMIHLNEILIKLNKNEARRTRCISVLFAAESRQLAVAHFHLARITRLVTKFSPFLRIDKAQIYSCLQILFAKSILHCIMFFTPITIAT